MAGERRFTRIPPESSGDRVGMNCFLEIAYTGATGTFNVGDVVDGVSSGVSGVVSYARADTGTTGIIVIDLSRASRENNTFATVGENLQVDAVTIAQSDTVGIEIYIPKYNLASGDNPTRLQTVDEQGAAQIRFSEGPAQLDAFGKLRTSESYVAGGYNFSGGLSGDFTSETATGGTVTHDATAGHIVLDATTSSGSASYYTSDLWHHYFAGVSQLGYFSLYNGDVGKTNNRRRWGMFDEFNGVFFELNGTTLYAVIRTNTSGSVTETRVAQSDWTTDVLDGSGSAENLSTLTLDLTAINLYWIDYEWLGAGRVRFGIFWNGQRITCHTYNPTNSPAWSKYGGFPIRYENENTGAAGSSSELRVVCCAVHSEADLDDLAQYAPVLYTNIGPVSVNTTADIYLGTLKTTANTHDCYLPMSFDVMAVEGANDATIEIEFTMGSTLTTPSFTQISDSNLEIDTAGSVNTPGTLLQKSWHKGGDRINFVVQNLQHGAYKTKANGESFSITLTATRIDGVTSNADVYVAFDFRDFRNQYG